MRDVTPTSGEEIEHLAALLSEGETPMSKTYSASDLNDTVYIAVEVTPTEEQINTWSQRIPEQMYLPEYKAHEPGVWIEWVSDGSVIWSPLKALVEVPEYTIVEGKEWCYGVPTARYHLAPPEQRDDIAFWKQQIDTVNYHKWGGIHTSTNISSLQKALEGMI